jgi:hypothetical protein
VSALRAHWTGIALASAALAGAFEVADLHSPLRVAVMLWFVLVCPGMAVVRLLRLHDPADEIALAVALSVALATAVAGIGLYSGLWAPGATLSVLIFITVGAAVAPRALRGPGGRP